MLDSRPILRVGKIWIWPTLRERIMASSNGRPIKPYIKLKLSKSPISWSKGTKAQRKGEGFINNRKPKNFKNWQVWDPIWPLQDVRDNFFFIIISNSWMDNKDLQRNLCSFALFSNQKHIKIGKNVLWNSEMTWYLQWQFLSIMLVYLQNLSAHVKTAYSNNIWIYPGSSCRMVCLSWADMLHCRPYGLGTTDFMTQMIIPRGTQTMSSLGDG